VGKKEPRSKLPTWKSVPLRRLYFRPLLQHERPLPHRQPDPRPVLGSFCENLLGLFEVVAGVQKAVDLRAVLGPLLDLVKVAIVREERVVGFLFRPIRLVGLRHVSPVHPLSSSRAPREIYRKP
jgi:hypothetical protein